MPPFTVLHVCMGNICRSPMAERLFALAAGDGYVYSHSAGTGGWHAGGPMDDWAARQIRERGGDVTGFVARQLRAEHIESSDLILTATAEQQDFVLSLRPDAADRTFVLGEFGRLLRAVDLAALPPAARSAEAVHERGVALVSAVAKARGGQPPRPGDDLDDPWGRGRQYFSRVADEIERTVGPLAKALL